MRGPSVDASMKPFEHAAMNSGGITFPAVQSRTGHMGYQAAFGYTRSQWDTVVCRSYRVDSKVVWCACLRARACVRVHACACMRARACVHAFACMRGRACVHACACMRLRACVGVHACMRARACVCVRAWACMRGRACVGVHAFACMRLRACVCVRACTDDPIRELDRGRLLVVRLEIPDHPRILALKACTAAPE
jgi:hypothetical protein